MAIIWNKIDDTNRNRLFAHLRREVCTPENYGWRDGEWNLTELCQVDLGRAAPFFQIIAGHDDGTGKYQPGAEMRDDNGFPFMFRLEVLSRQACVMDETGAELDPKQFHPTEPPKPGDVVEWKTHPRRPDVERHITTAQMNTWRRRGERRHEYAQYKVDADKCILVPINVALPMLQKHGERVVFPEFRGRGGGRSIANWRFREVPRDYVSPERKKKRGRKPAESKGSGGSAVSDYQPQTVEKNDGNLTTN